LALDNQFTALLESSQVFFNWDSRTVTEFIDGFKGFLK